MLKVGQAVSKCDSQLLVMLGVQRALVKVHSKQSKLDQDLVHHCRSSLVSTWNTCRCRLQAEKLGHDVDHSVGQVRYPHGTPVWVHSKRGNLGKNVVNSCSQV